jgi:hypothetical protein
MTQHDALVAIYRSHTEAENMKPILLALVCLAVGALGTGCEPSEPSPKAPASLPSQATPSPAARAASDIPDPVSTGKDYAYTQRAEFAASMQAELDGIQRELDQVEARLAKVGDAARAETQPKLKTLREQVARLAVQLDAVRDATESTWTDVKAGFNRGYAELKDGFQAARQWASDKIAP